MGGFLTQTLNCDFKQSLFEIIIEALVSCKYIKVH